MKQLAHHYYIPTTRAVYCVPRKPMECWVYPWGVFGYTLARRQMAARLHAWHRLGGGAKRFMEQCDHCNPQDD